ncbi:MAG: RecB family exonuclease [Fimbriimonadaceae bacterium]
MPRKPTLSPSRITTYLACPVKYRWTYLDPRGRWYMRSKSYYSFGTSLHRVLERFHDSDDAGVKTVDEAIAAVEESWIDAGYGSAEEMAEALGEGKAMIERYVEDEIAHTRGGRNLLTEKTLNMQFERFKLVGRPDRVDELDDGTLEIVDYKSGRTTVTAEEVANDVALGCYQLLVRQLYPGRRTVATIVALRSGDRATSGMTDSEVARFQADIEALGNEILDIDYPELTPVPKDICPRCDFLPLCRRHPDFVIGG